MTSVQRIGIYTRISEDDEMQGKGVQRQREDCLALVARLGWPGEVVDFEENDTSATRTKLRPVYEQLMTEARAGRITHIVVWDADRLTRTPREAEDLIDLVNTHGVLLANATGDEDLTTSDGRMMFRIKITVARREVEQTSKRLRRMNDQRAAEGVPAGQVGYGFARIDGSVVAVPEQVVTIHEAVRRVLAGDSLRAVCADFQERGIPTPGRGAAWNTTTLKQLLLRESLAGLRRHRGEVVGEMHPDVPRIITVDEHERLKALLNDPRRRSAPVGRAPKYLLGGIAQCGRCGGTMARMVGRLASTKRGGTKRQPPAYACADCHGVRRKQDFVDAVVEGVLIARLSAPDAAELFAHGDAGAAADARSALEAVQARLSNAADAFAAGSLELDQLTRITGQLRTEKERLETVLLRALPPAVPLDIVGPHAAERWDELSMDAKRSIVRMLLRVTILPSGPGKAFDPESVQIEWLSEAT